MESKVEEQKGVTKEVSPQKGKQRKGKPAQQDVTINAFALLNKKEMKVLVEQIYTQQKPPVLKTLLAIYAIVNQVDPKMETFVDPFNSEAVIKLLKKVLNADNCDGNTPGLIAKMRDYDFSVLSADRELFVRQIMSHTDLKVNLKIYGDLYKRFQEFLHKAYEIKDSQASASSSGAQSEVQIPSSSSVIQPAASQPEAREESKFYSKEAEEILKEVTKTET